MRTPQSATGGLELDEAELNARGRMSIRMKSHGGECKDEVDHLGLDEQVGLPP